MAFGVLVLGVLALVSGLFSLLLGIGLSGVGGLSWLSGVLFSDSLQTWGGASVGSGLLAIGAGVAQLVTGLGLLARQRWAWLLALLSAGAAAITPLIALLHGKFSALFGLVLPVGILFYLLFDDDVQAAFGRARATGHRR